MSVWARKAGAALFALIALAAAGASFVAPHPASRQFSDFEYAPPMPPRLVGEDGRWRAPFVYPLRLANRLERQFLEDRTRPMPLRWFSGSAIVSVDESNGRAPWLPLGGDPLGRDIFARLVHGARFSLGVSVVAAAAALVLGALLGACAGFAGGRVDDIVMRGADFLLVLPAIYVVIVLRGSMPLVLPTVQVFWIMTAVLTVVGWPYPARGVRAIVASERRREYAEAARAIGAGPMRILLRHLLPASGGFLGVQAGLLLPAFILAEATLSFVGFGFPEPTPSWGVMLHDAAQAGTLSEAPWLLAPAVAIVLTVLAVNLIAGRARPAGAGARNYSI